MKKLIPVVLLLMAVAFSSCNSRSSMVKKIEPTENSLKSDTTQIPSAEKVKAVQALYLEFADKYPADSMAPEYLFRAADLAIYLRDYKSTIGLYDRILTEHKQFSKLPQTLFMKAFAYDQYLQDPMKAAEFYRQFISLYPDHELADDASQALLFCGKSDQEVLEILQQRAADEADSAQKVRQH